MIGIMEKNVILMASWVVLLFLYRNDASVMGGYQNVLVFLFALILTELCIYFSNRKAKAFALAVYALLCLFQWQFIFFLPVVIYFLVEERFRYGFWILLMYILLYQQTVSFRDVVAGMMLCAISFLLAHENMQKETYRKKYLELRDSSTELENKLKLKNRELLESQDASVSMATLKERNRIAREIHDNVGHMLSRTILQTGALMTIYKEEPLHGQIQSVNESLNEAMNNIRESVHDLHDESVDLKLSITEVLKPLQDKYVIRFAYDMSNEVERSVKYCFISIVKEATANIVKHSAASKISILMREHPGFYQLAIEDDGTGKIDRSHEGIGLTNMRDRVEGLMGNLTISDENGFKILVSIPKKEEKEGI